MLDCIIDDRMAKLLDPSLATTRASPTLTPESSKSPDFSFGLFDLSSHAPASAEAVSIILIVFK